MSKHNGKHFIIQGGKAECSQGTKEANFKVTSHKKHYMNGEGSDDYLAVTEEDVQFNPPVQSFGECRLRPKPGGGFLPCIFAPAGKWQETYQKVKIQDKALLTEISKLPCVTGGEITVTDHGQRSEISLQNIKNADATYMEALNPLINFKAYQDEVLGNINPYLGTDQEEPEIKKLELQNIDGEEQTEFSFSERVRVKAFCVGLAGKQITFELTEQTTQHTQQLSALVDDKGMTTVDFSLSNCYVKLNFSSNNEEVEELDFNITAKPNEESLESTTVKTKGKIINSLLPLKRFKPPKGRSVVTVGSAEVDEKDLLSQMETVETEVITHFRPHKNWKGEFGFDWFREQNNEIKDKFDYNLMVGRYYKFKDSELLPSFSDNDFENLLKKHFTQKERSKFPKRGENGTYSPFYISDGNSWYYNRTDVIIKEDGTETNGKTIVECIENFKLDPQFAPKDNSLNELKKEYEFFKYDTQVGKGLKKEVAYLASYLYLFPEDENYGINTAQLQLHTKVIDGDKPDFMYFRIQDENTAPLVVPETYTQEQIDQEIAETENNKFIGIDQTKISKLKKNNKISITCKTAKGFDNDKWIVALVAIKQKDGSYKVSLAGGLKLLKPEVKELDVLVIHTKLGTRKSDDFGEPKRKWLEPFKNYMGQALIKVNIIKTDNKGEPIEINLSQNEESKKMYRLRGSNLLEEKKGFSNHMSRVFYAEYPELNKKPNTLKLFFLDVEKYENVIIQGEPNRKDTRGTAFGNYLVRLFSKHEIETIVHESFHALGLAHSFKYEPTHYVFKAMETDNIMDYSDWDKYPCSGKPHTPIKAYTTWQWQWRIVRIRIN